MIIALLALYPSSGLDVVVLVRLCFGAITYMEAGHVAHYAWFQQVQFIEGEWITSTVRFLTAAALIWMCVTGRWGGRPDQPSAGRARRRCRRQRDAPGGNAPVLTPGRLQVPLRPPAVDEPGQQIGQRPGALDGRRPGGAERDVLGHRARQQPLRLVGLAEPLGPFQPGGDGGADVDRQRRRIGDHGRAGGDRGVHRVRQRALAHPARAAR